MTQYQQKLQLGLERLKKAGNNPDLLGSTLTSFHGALEDYFRDWLSSRYYQQQALDRKQVQWKELLDLMKQYDGLSEYECQHILRMNSLRQEVAHGGHFTGTRDDVEAYADYVQQRIAQSFSSNAQQHSSHHREKQRRQTRNQLRGQQLLAGQISCPSCRTYNNRIVGLWDTLIRLSQFLGIGVAFLCGAPIGSHILEIYTGKTFTGRAIGIQDFNGYFITLIIAILFIGLSVSPILFAYKSFPNMTLQCDRCGCHWQEKVQPNIDVRRYLTTVVVILVSSAYLAFTFSKVGRGQ